MKTVITAALIALASITNAQAATARMISCEPGQSVTGRYGYVGLYEVYGASGAVQFTRFFSSFCPYSIEVQ